MTSTRASCGAYLRSITRGLHKNVVTVSLAALFDVTSPEIEPKSSRADSDVFNCYAGPQVGIPYCIEKSTS